MNRDIQIRKKLDDLKEYSLSNIELGEMLPDTNIVIYPELENIMNIDEVLDDNGNAILLYMNGDKQGHWVSLLKKGNEIEVYDPYGFHPSQWSKELTLPNEEIKYEGDLLISKIKGSGYKMKHNKKRAQPLSGDVNSCGRHAYMRVILGNYDLDEYNKIINNQEVSADDLVTAFTHELFNI
jgi:hypothetical protein